MGNIYASEALFAAGIASERAAGSVSRARYARLADEVKRMLAYAIERGGTTLRDFISPDGAPGYFEQELSVYGRAGEPCRRLRHADPAGHAGAALHVLVPRTASAEPRDSAEGHHSLPRDVNRASETPHGCC